MTACARRACWAVLPCHHLCRRLWRGILTSNATPTAPQWHRALDIAWALAGRGFSAREERRLVVAESTSVEAQDVTKYLRSLGFEDREYRVVPGYVRKWGIM